MPAPKSNVRSLLIPLVLWITVGAAISVIAAWTIQHLTARGTLGRRTMQTTLTQHDGVMYRKWMLDGQRRYSIGSTQWELLMEGWTPDVGPAPGWDDPEGQPSSRAAGFPPWGPRAPLESPRIFDQVTAFGWPLPSVSHRTIEEVTRAADGTPSIVVKTPGLIEVGDAVLAIRPVWTGLAVNAAVIGLIGFGVSRIPVLIRRRRRARAGACPRCGYDLSRTESRCPECGAEAAPFA